VIVVSVLLVVAAAALLARGMAVGLSEYLYASIVASAVAALALIVAVRRPLPLDEDFDVPVRPPRLQAPRSWTWRSPRASIMDPDP
jgi:hypothetical protein